MCVTCGCGSDMSHEEMHKHGIAHHHHDEVSTLEVEQDILAENNKIAMYNRGFWKAKKSWAMNLVSSPGSGKTTLLEATIQRLKGKYEMAVIEGDQQTSNDADRINRLGIQAVQINTQNGCHLDARMVRSAIETLDISDYTLLFIENVGNLVCPAMFDLGENARAVVISVTEGDDKPLKYPYMFESASICVINKVDLLPYVDCDLKRLKENAWKVNHHLSFFEVSATKGTGMDEWCTFLEKQIRTGEEK